MPSSMKDVRDAIVSGQAKSADYANMPLPESMLAVTTHKDEISMFEGLASEEKDPRKSLHLDEVPLPEVGPNEALVAVMATSINFNTVWSAIFEPIPTFRFLRTSRQEKPVGSAS